MRRSNSSRTRWTRIRSSQCARGKRSGHRAGTARRTLSQRSELTWRETGLAASAWSARRRGREEGRRACRRPSERGTGEAPCAECLRGKGNSDSASLSTWLTAQGSSLRRTCVQASHQPYADRLELEPEQRHRQHAASISPLHPPPTSDELRSFVPSGKSYAPAFQVS